jgi:hypothetical protein
MSTVLVSIHGAPLMLGYKPPCLRGSWSFWWTWVSLGTILFALPSFVEKCLSSVSEYPVLVVVWQLLVNITCSFSGREEITQHKKIQVPPRVYEPDSEPEEDGKLHAYKSHLPNL